MLLTSAIISGLGLGSMYGLIALGFHVTYVVSNTVNFSQGSAMMLGAVLGYTFAVTLGWPLPLAVVAALALCALFGAGGRAHPGASVRRARLECVADGHGRRRHRARQRGAVHLRQGAARLSVRAREQAGRRFSAPASIRCSSSFRWSGIAHRDRCCNGAVAARACGKALLAVVQNPDAARLMGINVRRAVAVSFMISTALAGLAGLLIAPLFSVHSDMGTLFGIKAFAVAILGGITSASGVMLAGLAYGLIEALVTAFLGSVYTQIVVFSRRHSRARLDAQRAVRARGGQQGLTMADRRQIAAAVMPVAIVALTAAALLVCGASPTATRRSSWRWWR